MKTKEQELIEKQREYIELLAKELDSAVSIAWLHHWRSRDEDILQGQTLRAEIIILEAEIAKEKDEPKEKHSFTRIKEFIQKQRYIGECSFGKRMRDNYSKRADDFYNQFAETVYYKDKDGTEIGLDIKTLWWFRTNEMLNNLAEAKKDEPKMTAEEMIREHCNIEFTKYSGEEVVHSLLSAVCIAVEEYHDQFKH